MAFTHKTRPEHLQVFLDGIDRTASNGDDSLLAALADAADVAELQIELIEGEVDDFTDTHARSVEQLQKGSIAKIKLIRRLWGAEQRFDLLVSNGVGNVLPAL